MRIRSKLFAMLLSLAMVITLMPVTAYAAGEGSSADNPLVVSTFAEFHSAILNTSVQYISVSANISDSFDATNAASNHFISMLTGNSKTVYLNGNTVQMVIEEKAASFSNSSFIYIYSGAALNIVGSGSIVFHNAAAVDDSALVSAAVNVSSGGSLTVDNATVSNEVGGVGISANGAVTLNNGAKVWAINSFALYNDNTSGADIALNDAVLEWNRNSYATASGVVPQSSFAGQGAMRLDSAATTLSIGRAVFHGGVAVNSATQAAAISTSKGIVQVQGSVKGSDDFWTYSENLTDKYIIGYYSDASFQFYRYSEFVSNTFKYPISVTNGTASSGGTIVTKAAAGSTITLTDVVPAGKVFDGWICNAGGVTPANSSLTTTTFIMPHGGVSFTAAVNNPEISSVSAEVTTPATGDAMQTALPAGAEEYDITSISWFKNNDYANPVSGNFEANTVYEVILTVEAKTGHSFANPFSVSISGIAGVVHRRFSNTEATIRCTFPATLAYRISGNITSYSLGDVLVKLYSSTTEDSAIRTDMKTGGASALANTSSSGIPSVYGATNNRVYSVSNVPAGTYKLAVYEQGHGIRITAVTVTSANINQNVTLYKLGDVNGNAAVDISDMQRLYEHLNGSNILTDADIGDVNENGVVDISDMQRLYEHLNGSNPLT